MIKTFIILLLVVLGTVCSMSFAQLNIFMLPLILFGILVLVLFIDSLIIKLPESNIIRKWWRKNVVESTP